MTPKLLPYTHILQLMLIFSLEIAEFSAPLRVCAFLFFHPLVDELALRVCAFLFFHPLVDELALRIAPDALSFPLP